MIVTTGRGRRAAARCEVINARTKARCKCTISYDNAYVRDRTGHALFVCCENHFKVLRRGGTITVFKRRWRWVWGDPITINGKQIPQGGFVEEVKET